MSHSSLQISQYFDTMGANWSFVVNYSAVKLVITGSKLHGLGQWLPLYHSLFQYCVHIRHLTVTDNC